MSTVSMDPATLTGTIDDLLGGPWPAQRKIVVEDADGHRFVLLPEDQFHALQQSAGVNGQVDVPAGGQVEVPTPSR